MRRSRDAVVRASLYLALALSGFAAAYVLKEWLPHFWDAPPRLPADDPDDKTSPSSPQRDSAPTAEPATDSKQAPPVRDARTPPPPLRTHSLPPPPPNGRPVLSGSFISPDTHTSSAENGIDEEGASQANASDTLSESFVDLLSPAPAQVTSRRHSVRVHDLFAESHMSFSELGSLVAPHDEPQ